MSIQTEGEKCWKCSSSIMYFKPFPNLEIIMKQMKCKTYLK